MFHRWARFVLAALTTCALFPSSALGNIWFPRELRRSGMMSAVRACRLDAGRAGRVCDLDGLLTAHQVDELDRASAALRKSSVCAPNAGLDAVVVLVRKVPRVGESAVGAEGVDESLQRAAESGLSYWRLGAACQNGMVLLVSAEDNEVYVATGRMARKTLSDDDLEDVGDEMEQYLHQGKAYHAIITGLRKVLKLLPEDGKLRQPQHRFFVSWGARLVYGAAVFMAILLFVAYSNHVERPGRAIRQGERERLVRNREGNEGAGEASESAGTD